MRFELRTISRRNPIHLVSVFPLHAYPPYQICVMAFAGMEIEFLFSGGGTFRSDLPRIDWVRLTVLDNFGSFFLWGCFLYFHLACVSSRNSPRLRLPNEKSVVSNNEVDVFSFLLSLYHWDRGSRSWQSRG